jgi:hypothetical protein
MGRFNQRTARARLFTTDEAAEVFPPLILMLLMGMAQVVFPTSDTPSPSVTVLIVPSAPRANQGWLADRGIQVSGPLVVRWDQWQNIMVPLLASIQGTDGIGLWGSLNITNPLNRIQLCHVGEARRLMGDLADVIRRAFEEAGYG